MILASFKMMIPSDKRSEVVSLLSRTVERTRVEPSCVSCHFYHDFQDERGLVLEEIWKTEDDLVRHLKSEDFRNVLLVAEMSLVAPEIIFSTVIPGSGMTTIEKARIS
jgi:quinol monooxygenase YgiN